MKALRKWCGRNALRHIAVALGLTLMDVLLFLALWKLYLHLFNDLVPSTVKNSDVLLYVSPVLLLSNFMRLEVKPRNDERADSKAKGAAEVIIAALICGALLLLPLGKPGAIGVILWLLGVVCVSMLIFAFSEVLTKLGDK